MVVILSDAEAENVAQILRRMNERVDAAEDHTVAYVDDRGPTDFAKQLEALADAGDENVYVPLFTLGDAPAACAAFVTRTAADEFAAKTGVPHTQKVPVKDPDDPIPDDRPGLEE